MGLMERDAERAAAVLVARRCTMHPDPSLVNSLVGKSRDEAISLVLSAAPDQAGAPVSDSSNAALEWWFARMARSPSSLQDRMTFFWHTLVPTNRYGVGIHELVALQLNMIRAKCLGNFRDLMHAFVVDGALIRFLDADTSTDKKTNENLPRELMELFTVGIGAYSEADVRAAAQAMTGWIVDEKTFQTRRDETRSDFGEVTFMGETKAWDVHSIVDRLCDHPATAARVGARVWYHFTGERLDQGGRAELGRWWQSQGLEILPLLERTFTSSAFWANHYVRPRSGFEFFMATYNLLKYEADDFWRCQHLGQMPYEPPNVGGWEEGERWITTDGLLRRSEQVFSLDLPKVHPGYENATVDDVLDACSLWVVSDETRAMLDRAWGQREAMGHKNNGNLVWRLALSSPEYQLQ